MLRHYVLAAFLLFAAVGAIPAMAQTVQTFTVTNNGATDYRFDGNLDPTLTLIRGKTYAFNITATGHPFFIAASGPNNAAAPAFTDGVTGNNTTAGTLTFAVPTNAPSPLFYQCGIHNAMSGTLLIQDAPPPVPALGSFALLALGVVILVAGYLARRQRAGRGRD